MKKQIFVVFLLAFAIDLIAQDTVPGEKKFMVGAGPRIGIPQRDFKRVNNFAVGVDVQGEAMFTSFFSGVITTGFTYFPRKSQQVGAVSRYVIPVMGGLRIYPVKAFFLGGKAGIAMGSFYNLNYEPQIGVNTERFQLALGYNVIFLTDYRYDHLGLNFIYKFR